MASPRASKCPVVAVLNMKGGVGKTTITGNVFRELFRIKAIPTLLIDFDSQFNLSQLLLTRNLYEHLEQDNRTVFSILNPPSPQSVFATTADYFLELPTLESIIYTLKSLQSNNNIKLDLIPGSFELARLNLRDTPQLRIPAKRLHAFIDQARQEYGLVVMDCNPSSSFSTKCAINAATHILIPVRPDKYSILGVQMLWNYCDELRPHNTPIRKILMNDYNQGQQASRNTDNELRGHHIFGPHVLAARLRHSTLLSAKRDYTGFAADRRVPYREVIARELQTIATEFASAIGI